MSVRTLKIPKSPELQGEISLDSIRSIVNDCAPNLSPLKVNEIVFRLGSLIGFKDKSWDLYFKQSYKTHQSVQH